MKSNRISLGKIGELRQGLTLSRYLSPTGLSRFVLQVANLDGTKVKVREGDRTETMDASRIKEFEARPGQVLVSLRGSALKAAVVPEDLDEAVVSNSLAIFDVDQTVADPVFIAGLLNSASMQKRVATLFTGVTIQGIPLSRFKQVEIDLPSLEEQTRFKTAFEALEEYKAAVAQFIEKRDEELESHLHKFVIKEKA